MAFMTRAEIVAQGLARAGRGDELTTEGNSWLQNWLNSVAAAWNWPILRRESAVTLSTQTKDFGANQGGISDIILRVLDEIWWYLPDGSAYGRIKLRDQNSPPIEKMQPSTVTGAPQTVRSLKAGYGVHRLSFNPTPDQTYNLYLPFQTLGVQMTADTDVPWFEDDETMIQAVTFKALEYADGSDSPSTQAAQLQLVALLNNAKYRHGNAAGQNDTIFKDPKVFPRSRK